MKLLLLSDIHFSDKQPVGRKDDIYKAGLEKLHIIFSHANNHKIPILQAGDLTDKADKKRNYKCLNNLIGLFQEFRWLQDNFYCVYGQHDMYGSNKENTCLFTLENLGYVNILSGDSDYFPLYGAGWGEDKPEKMMSQESVFVTHKSISNTDTIFDTVSAKDYLSNFKNTIILCGDIHKKFVIENKEKNSIIINTGPIIRRSVNECDHSPYYAIIDTDSKELEWYDLPDNAIFSKEHIEMAEIQKQSKLDLENMIKSLSGFKKGASFRDNLVVMLENDTDEKVSEKLWGFIK